MQVKDRNNQAPSTKQKTSVLAFFVSILNEAAEFKGWQAIFQILLWTFVMWAVYNLKILYEFHNAPEYAHIPKYSIYDFKLSLIFVAAFLVYKHVSQIVFYRFVRNILDPLKFKTEAEFDKKAKIGALWVANLIYYSASSITCYILFKDQDFFPKLLGGKGDAANVFKVLPSNIYIPNGVEFYMVQFACHLHTLIDYIVYRWRDPNFWEMFLHHSLSVFLIFFSYATNNIAVGILVLFVHDPCDVCLYLNRLMSDSKYKNIPVKAVIFGVFIYVWIYLRIYAFPRCIIKACFDFMSSADSGIMYSPYMFMTLMLTALVILHCYWLMNILRVMFNLIRGKTNYNVYDNKKGNKSDDAPRASS